MSRVQQTMDYLIKVIEKLDKFDGKVATPKVRKELSETLKELTSSNSNFVRKDNDKVIELYWGTQGIEFGMSPEAEIGLDKGNKVWVQTWTLWKTVYSYQEQIEEQRAYEGY